MTSYNKQDPKTIQAMFASIAKSYDRTNAVLSFQMHRLWNRRLIQQVYLKNPSEVILDLCCGTGEIALNYLKTSQKPCQAYLLDFCHEMLACAEDKATRTSFPHAHHLSYLQADAQAIPLDSNLIQSATVAYGIRNVKDPQKCMQEVFRVLRPGGVFGILELTEPSNFFLRMSHRLYLRTLLPILGKLLTSNQDAYQYLCQSIHTFISPQELKKMLCQVGFEQVTKISLSGGIATILIAKKPC